MIIMIQKSGYSGIKHCFIPSPKYIVLDYDKKGKLIDWAYAKEQSAASMLKILGNKLDVLSSDE